MLYCYFSHAIRVADRHERRVKLSHWRVKLRLWFGVCVQYERSECDRVEGGKADSLPTGKMAKKITPTEVGATFAIKFYLVDAGTIL